MQFSILALTAFVAAVSAASNGTVEYTTEVVTAYVTVCPTATVITHGDVKYTATANQTLTVTNCPCTIVKPVVTSSIVICSTCAPTASPHYNNGTAATTTTKPIVGTLSMVPTTTPAATTSLLSANSGSKAFAFSGASLAGLLGFAAYFL